MYQPFAEIDTKERPIFKFPEWDYIRRTLAAQNTKIVEFYRRNPTTVKSNHILVRLIDSFNVPYREDLGIYTGQVRDKAYALAMALRITTPAFKGRVFTEGYFAGSGSREIIVAVNEPFSLSESIANWRDLQPIKVLSHGNTQLLSPILDGRRPVQQGGLFIVGINIPLLALQYQCWRKEYTVGKDSPLGIEHFIRMFPIPNMIYSFQDYAVFNRINLISQNKDIPKAYNPHSFQLIDLSQRVDASLARHVQYIKQKPMPYDQLLKTLPAINVPNLAYTLKIPDTLYTRQIKWALAMARLPAVEFMLRINAINNYHANRAANNFWRIQFRGMYYDNVFSVGFSQYESTQIWRFINEKITAYL